jgi:hypothetical protein
VAVLLALLDEAFDRRSWHGPNLRNSLRGVDPALAIWRPGRDRHSIWELATHTAYWKYVVRRRLRSERRGRFALPGSNFFPVPERADAVAWKASLGLLETEHAALQAATRELTDGDLNRRVGRGQDTIGGLVRGAAAHDLYHGGQIRLIRRMAG